MVEFNSSGLGLVEFNSTAMVLTNEKTHRGGGLGGLEVQFRCLEV